MKLYHPAPNDPAPAAQPDPYILEHNGVYYIYATGGAGVSLYISDNFTDWRYAGLCYTEPGRRSYWAPAVMQYEDKFYMYVSSMPQDEADPHLQCIRVAVSDQPEGPFVYQKTLLEPFSIDPHAVNTPSGMYLFYCVNDWESERPGTLIVVDKLLDPLTVEGNPKVVVRATLDEEIHGRDRFAPGHHWHTVEGAYYFSERDCHYLMYSGSGYGQPTYFVGYSVAHGTPDDLRDLDWHKYPDDHTYAPLLAQNEWIEGTGHNSLIKKDDQWWVVYHGRDRGTLDPKKDMRVMRADQMTVDGERLFVTLTR